MKKKVILLAALSLLIGGLTCSLNISRKNSDMSKLTLNDIIRTQTAEAETMQECQQYYCPDNGIVCTTEDCGVPVAFFWYKGF